MSSNYDDLCAQARMIIDEHNVRVPTPVDLNEFCSKLRGIGGTTVEALRACSWEDLEGIGVPRLLARQIAAVFRKGVTGDQERDTSAYVSAKKAEKMTIRELLEHYDPNERPSHVTDRLRAISNNRLCIVLQDDGTVDVAASEKLFGELQKGYTEREVYTEEWKAPRTVYCVGAQPAQLVDENPLFPGKALRPEGSCSVTNRSWNNISFRARQIVRIAMELQELRMVFPQDAHPVLDFLEKADDEKINQRLPRAVARYAELQRVDQLPKLKITLPKRGETPKHNNPFGGAENRQF